MLHVVCPSADRNISVFVSGFFFLQIKLNQNYNYNDPTQ